MSLCANREVSISASMAWGMGLFCSSVQLTSLMVGFLQALADSWLARRSARAARRRRYHGGERRCHLDWRVSEPGPAIEFARRSRCHVGAGFLPPDPECLVARPAVLIGGHQVPSR